jgi:acetolactate decarboxylase
MPFGRWLAKVFARPAANGETRPHELFQASTLHALELGRFRGVLTVGELRRHGDLGLGAFDQLDGEMIMLDGHVRRVTSDGAVHDAGDRETLAYALATPFAADARFVLRGADSLESLARQLDSKMDQAGTFHALRVRGRFEELLLRSPKPAETPHQSLDEALRDQAEFRLVDTPAALAGFYSPETAQGLDPAGYHFHALSEDGLHGGHVVDLRAGELHVELDATPRLQLRLNGE